MKQKAFTLIEILIAVGIMAGISIVLAQSLFTANRTSVKSDVKNTIKQGGDFSLRLMEQFIRSAIDISSESCTGVPRQNLVVTNKDQGQTTYDCLYDETNEVTRIASVSATANGSVIEYITPSSMTLGSTCTGKQIFTCTASPGVPKKVRINFSLAQKGTPAYSFEQGSVAFDSTVTLRN